MNNLYQWDRELLPEGFRFPGSYIALMSGDSLPDIEPWWWLPIRKESCLFWLETLRKQYPDRQLIPFAKMENSDDVACFDGADRSGNPHVFYIHSYTTSGWESRGQVDGFDEWLDLARRESVAYKVEKENEE